MNARVTEINDQARALSADDRLELVTMLWDSLAQDEKTLHDESEAVALARQRAQELDSGAVTASSHEEVMAHLKACGRHTKLF